MNPKYEAELERVRQTHRLTETPECDELLYGNFVLSYVNRDIWFVRDRMSSEPVTITPDTPFQEALKLMREHRFRRLPVVDKKGKLVGIVSERDLLVDEQNHVVGVITETDIFKTFVEMLGGGRAGLRLTLKVPERKGVLADLSRAIFDLGGNIVSVGSFYGDSPGERELVVKVRDVSKDQLVETLEALGDHVVDAREV